MWLSITTTTDESGTLQGVITRRDGVPTLDDLQTAVDGYIETAASVPCSDGVRELSVYCNEEGSIRKLPICMALSSTLRADGPLPIFGSLCVAAHNTQTGEGTAMTAAECDAFTWMIVRYYNLSLGLFRLPVLTLAT